jgi:hypothetical protein
MADLEDQVARDNVVAIGRIRDRVQRDLRIERQLLHRAATQRFTHETAKAWARALERVLLRACSAQSGPLRAGGTAGVTPLLPEESQGPGPPDGSLPYKIT